MPTTTPSRPTRPGTAGPRPVPRRDSHGPLQIIDRLGLSRWQWETALNRGAAPGPDLPEGRWSEALAASIAERLPEIVDLVGTEHPIGARRCAERLADRTGTAATFDDITTLCERGQLAAVGSYKDHPLYDVRHIDALDVEVVWGVVEGRQAWEAQSLTVEDAAALLTWSSRELRQVAKDRGIEIGSHGRFTRTVIEALAGDEELHAQVRGARLLRAEDAGRLLGITAVDFRYVLAAGWLTPARPSAGRGWRVARYRQADVEALRGRAGVDWPAVREHPAGRVSPLHWHAHQPGTPLTVIRGFADRLSAEHGCRVWHWLDAGTGVWHLETAHPTNHLTGNAVRALFAADPATARACGEVCVDCDAGRVMRWAYRMLGTDTAVILDTETTDLYGAVCEIAVTDAHSGAVLLDTLVNPRVPMEPEAQDVHGITADDVADAPLWEEVWPRVLDAIGDRRVLAYNAPYDRDVIVADCARVGIAPGGLADPTRWGCVMRQRQARSGSPRWTRLNGGHRAVGDCAATRRVLQGLVLPPRTRAW